MTRYIKKNGCYFVNRGIPDYAEALDPALYQLDFNPMAGGFYLKPAEQQAVPERVYGATKERVNRYVTTFLSRDTTTGVLLSGDKGSGKSMEMRALAATMVAMKMPVIYVGFAASGDAFNEFLQHIKQPCMVAIDEFEKVYNEMEKQNELLSLLDGVTSTKKLFALTVNDRYKVNEHMRNRPGRLFYNVEFRGVGEDVIRQYAGEQLQNKEHLDSLIRVSHTLDSFNFDMLKSLVEEMNRFHEDATSAVRYMNIRPETLRYVSYNTTVRAEDPSVKAKIAYGETLDKNPLTGPVELYVMHTVEAKKPLTVEEARKRADDEDDEAEVTQIIEDSRFSWSRKAVRLQPGDLLRADDKGITMRRDGFIFTFERQSVSSFAY